MPKQSESEVPRCLSAFCDYHAPVHHNVGHPRCSAPVVVLTPAQRRVWRMLPLGSPMELTQNHGRIRLQCLCGSMAEDFEALKHADHCTRFDVLYCTGQS